MFISFDTLLNRPKRFISGPVVFPPCGKDFPVNEPSFNQVQCPQEKTIFLPPASHFTLSSHNPATIRLSSWLHIRV